MNSEALDAGKSPESSRAVAQLVDWHACHVEQRHQQVSLRHVVAHLERHMTPCLQFPVRVPEDDAWQVEWVVAVRLAEARAVEDDHVIEQRAVAVRRLLQLLEDFYSEN